MMNEFFAQKFVKSKQDIYSPLTDHMEVMECTPVKLPPPVNKSKMFGLSRRLFSKSNNSFKLHQKNSTSKSKFERIRTLFRNLHSKLQAWSQETQDNPQENKTPNFTTPNRRVRCMLGRTPEQLYSPFCIETPPSHFKKRNKHVIEFVEYPFPSFHDWLTPPKHKPLRRKSKIVTNLF